ncbi:sulfotransferase family 2 domain-containing protein [Roseobacter litoralis]|uniref:sulfotransferase family 2 domain-containing protein n=1 Tax=Roseobacter litoralis TaxID=42443 RepID=UPI0024936203|nr:sulfotransferase family 2 domain-containing protein [Roseobacter litoralis]
MPIITAGEKKLYFAHVPKVGGTSVVDYLTRRFDGPLAMNGSGFYNSGSKADMIIAPAHITARTAAVMLPHDIDHSFTVVRDPLSRMLSQYRFQAGISRMSQFGFSTWLRIVLQAARLDPRVYGNHIRPQSDIVPEQAVVFKLENRFTDMIVWLDEITGQPAPEVGVGHLLKREKAAVTVLRQDAEVIAAYYRADYERFGYALPDFDTYSNDTRVALRRLAGAGVAYPLVKRQQRRWVQ